MYRLILLTRLWSARLRPSSCWPDFSSCLLPIGQKQSIWTKLITKNQTHQSWSETTAIYITQVVKRREERQTPVSREWRAGKGQGDFIYNFSTHCGRCGFSIKCSIWRINEWIRNKTNIDNKETSRKFTRLYHCVPRGRLYSSRV